MNKLQSELLRLYVPRAAQGSDEAPDAPALVDAEGQVRAVVLTVSAPADWALLAPAWQGVQADLELPAPAIAVSGADGIQLWFSLAEPVPAAQAAAFADALRERYLGDVRIERVGMMPALDASLPPTVRHAAPVPALQAGGERWSAFVAPDLAPVFAEEPWLDTPPNPEGQAELLARLKSIPLAEFRRALDRLRPAPHAAEHAATSDDAVVSRGGHATFADESLDPKRFLLAVMADRSVALALRIEAAKALLLAGSD